MKIIQRAVPKPKPAEDSALGFGKYFTDYIFTMRYREGIGWYDAAVVPNEPIAFDPAASVFHYAQGIFEGMKAFLQPDGSIGVFRPEENWARMQRSADRMCIPAFPEALAEEGLETLLRLERDWIPHGPGTALYIRPAIVATRAELGVHASSEYLFFILLSPVGSYFAHGTQPVKLLAEDVYARVAPGGTGEAKCLGNYAASLKAAEIARRKGFDQVLWLDPAEKKYVEEVGSMNIFFVIDGETVTPSLSGTILPGITRKSCIAILNNLGRRVSERRISVEELVKASQAGTLTEAFGTGTAAVISPVGEICYRGETMKIGTQMGETAALLYDTLTGIQRGTLPDRYGWVKKIF